MADPMVEKYKQLVANGVDPMRAKGLLKQAQGGQQPTQQSTQVKQEFDPKQSFGSYLKESAQQTFAPAVGFAQGVSDVGQRTVGRFSDWIGKGIAEKVTGKQLEGPRQTAGNIMPSLLGKQAESGMAKFGRGAGQFAGTTLLTAPIGGAASGLTKAGQAATRLGGLARGAISGGITGAAGTQIGMLAGQDRFATAGETLGGAALGGAIGGALGARAVGKSQKLEKLLIEKPTSKNIQRAAEQGRVKFTKGLTKAGGEITPTERTANATNIVKKEIGKYKNPQDLVNKMNNLGKTKYKELSNDLKNIKVGTMTKDKAQITNKIKEIKGLKDEWVKSDIQKINQLSKNIKQAKTADDLWKARTTWDKLFSEAQKKATDKSAPSTRNAQKLWLEGRDIMNKSLDNIVKKQGGEGVRGKFFDMSSLLETKDNLVSKMPELIKEKQTKAGTALKYIGGTALAGGGLAILKNLVRGASGE